MNTQTQYLGLDLPHPIIAGASPLSYRLDTLKQIEDGGAAAVVLHSLFEEQISHEQWGIDTFVEGLENVYAEATSFFPGTLDFKYGPEGYLKHIQQAKSSLDIPVIASINGIHDGTWEEYAQMIEQAGADAIELNLYVVPTNISDSGAAMEARMLNIVKGVKVATNLPIAVKLSPYYSSLTQFSSELEALGVEAQVLFNRFYQPDIDLDELEVVPSLSLSDSSELPLRLRWLSVLKGALSKTDFALSGGAHTARDVIKAIMCGANSVQMVSALLRNGPGHVQTVLKGVVEFLEEKEYESLGQMQGSMSYKNCPNPEAIERANYMKVLQSFKVT